MNDNDEYEKAIENHDELITRYYKISARNEGQLNVLEKFFAYVQYLSRVGASRTVKVYIDGDGAVSFKFKTHDSDEFLFKELDCDNVKMKNNGYGEIFRCSEDGKIVFDLG